MLHTLLSCYKPYKGLLAFIIIGSFVASGLELFFPIGMREILNDLIPKGDMKSLLLAAGGMTLLYIFSYLLNWAVFTYGKGMGASIEYDLRNRLFRHTMDLSYSYFDNARTGQMVSRIVNDISEVGNLMFAIPNLLIVCSVTMLGTIIMLFWINIPLASVVSVLLVLKAYEAVETNKKMKVSFMEARRETGNLSGKATESLDAVRLVKAFNNEDLENKKLDDAGKSLLSVQKKTFRIVGRMNGSLVFFSNITNLIIVVLGGAMTAMGKMEPADLIAFLLYMMVFMRPVFQLTMLTEVYQRGMAGYRRYQEIVSQAPEIADDKNVEIQPVPKGNIEFKNVFFSYRDDLPVLKDFNLTVHPGEIIAVVGPTGSGKSTVCQLLMRMYDIDSGDILIDGTSIKKWSLKQLRQNIGIVQQDVFLFSDSVKENIAYGRPSATDEEIAEAANRAQAHEFIAALPEGYATAVGERGVKLSGGQKQRIAIARIFLKNPPILVLDEATSALDNETEQQVREALDSLAEHRTTIVVAHRLASITDDNLTASGNIVEAVNIGAFNMLQSVLAASRIKGIAVSKERQPALLLNQVRNGLGIVWTKEGKIPQLAKVHFYGYELFVKINILYAGSDTEALKLRGPAGAYLGTEICEINLGLFHGNTSRKSIIHNSIMLPLDVFYKKNIKTSK